MKITREFLDAGRSERGGWLKAQLAILGVSWPPMRGWPARVLGKEIPDSAAERFVALKNTQRATIQ
jgi:hypothetical protein